tara:strand:- start:20246 stop:20944 length:699 start_codon:yes stop_codon:yes gene_type:complete
MKNNDQYSDYSRHFENLNEDLVLANKLKMARIFEEYLLYLDVRIIQKNLYGDKILDFPIGTGRIYKSFLSKGFNVYGYDICAPYIEAAKNENSSIADNFSVYSFENVNVEHNKFDTVVSLRVLSNIKELDMAFNNIFNLLNNKGRWIFNVPPSFMREDNFNNALNNSGFSVKSKIYYDWISSFREMTSIEKRARNLIVRLLNKKVVPLNMFKILDYLMPRKGRVMFVLEKND